MKSDTLDIKSSRLSASIKNLLRFKTETLSQGLWLLVVTIVSGVFNYLANISVGRLLIPSEYSEYVSLLSISLILGSVTAVLQTVITSQVSRIQTTSGIQQVGPLITHILRKSLFWAVLIWVAFILSSGKIASALNLNTRLSVIIIGATIVPLTGLSILQGGMRGLERYYLFGVSSMGVAFSRLIIGVVFIIVGWGVLGATASLPLSYFLVFIISFTWLSSVIDRSNHQNVPKVIGLLSYTLFTAVGIFAFTSLYNMDVIVVKSHFSAQEAGYYSAIATLGKIVLYLPSAVATLLISKVAILDSEEKSTTPILWKSLFVVGTICGIITLLFYSAPYKIVEVFFGAKYLNQFYLLGPYSLAMLFYSLCNIWLAYFLALKRKLYSYALFAIAIAQAVFLSTILLSLEQIIYSLIFFGILTNIIGVVLLLRRQKSVPVNADLYRNVVEGT